MRIQENDVVIVYIKQKMKKKIIVKSEEVTHLPIGLLRHTELINQDYGKKHTLKGGSFYALREDVGLKVEMQQRRTQILFEQDIALIMMLLDLNSTSKIIECGTGSGMLTSVLNGIVKNGKVFTFEKDEERYNLFLKDCKDYKYENVVSYKRDIVTYGFDVGEVDAIFLDIPNPFMAISHIQASLKITGKFVIFVISFEQVEQVIKNLKWARNVRMFECVIRRHKRENINKKNIFIENNQCIHTGYLISGVK